MRHATPEAHEYRVITTVVGEFTVETMFVGIDGFSGTRLHFSTMVFRNKAEACWGRCYNTFDEAEKGHEDAVDRLRKDWIPNDDSATPPTKTLKV